MARMRNTRGGPMGGNMCEAMPAPMSTTNGILLAILMVGGIRLGDFRAGPANASYVCISDEGPDRPALSVIGLVEVTSAQNRSPKGGVRRTGSQVGP